MLVCPWGTDSANFMLGPRCRDGHTKSLQDPSGDRLGRGQTRAQVGSVRVGSWEMRHLAGVCKEEAGRGWRVGKCGACWILGSHRAITWRTELGRQTPERIRKAGVGGWRLQVTCGLRGRVICQK